MDDKLDFSVPEKKQRSPIANKVIIVLLLILTALAVVNVLPESGPADPAGQSSGLSATQTKQLATKLAQRNLYEQAAQVWKDYLAQAKLGAVERAKGLFQAATALEKAGLYGQAIEYYYRSETVALLDDLAPQINSHIKDCFERLGKFSALQYELMDRTALKTEAPAGADVVAEIGAEKITKADLDALIENSIDNQLAPVAAFMTPEQLAEQKKKTLDQYKNPQAKQQFLQGWLAQEILYRQALEEQLAAKPKVKAMLDDVARGMLSQQIMNEQLASKINITETDLQTYYSANKDKYITPAKATISHILLTDEKQAKELIKQIKEGADFAAMAKQHSLDEATKQTGGRIEAEVTLGAIVPVIGDANGLNEAIFAAEPAKVLDQPFDTEKGWEIVRIDDKQPERQRTFDEVRQDVMMTLANQKRQDVQQTYVKQMMDKYNVIVHNSVLAPSQQEEAVEQK